MTNPETRILLVEDDEDHALLVQRSFLKQKQGVQLKVVKDGQACMEQLSRFKYSLVLLDYSLPRMDGIKVLRKIQEAGHTIPIVIITGQGTEEVAVDAMKLGASDYITKSTGYANALPNLVGKVLEQRLTSQRLQAAEERLQLLKDISIDLSVKLKLEELAQGLVEGACRLVNANAGMVVFLSADGTQGEISETKGLTMPATSLIGPIQQKGIFGWVVNNRAPILTSDLEADPKIAGTPAHQPPLKRAIGIPIYREDTIQAVLVVGDPEIQDPFTQADAEVLTSLCTHAGSVLINARYLEQIELLAITDSLTGLFNHREFHHRLAEELERSKRYHREFSLLIMDMDHFKHFNDTYGHPVGDQALKHIGKIISEHLRNIDVPCRYGGEEFAAILPETNEDDAVTVAQRLENAVHMPFSLKTIGEDVRLSVSIGIASFPIDTTDRDELIQFADQALYFAKEAGRNQVCRYSQTLKATIDHSPDLLQGILKDTSLAAIKDLACAVDAKTPYTRGHSVEVARYALLLARGLRLSKEDKQSLQMASLLHNIGTVNIPEKVLNKPGRLTVEERKMIQAHPGLAEMILKKAQDLDSVIPAILYHHERWDGHGYPKGIQGEEIPCLARILGIVEAYHAMISVRPYRKKLSQEEAFAELRNNSGSQFDPEFVTRFIELIGGS